MGNVNKIRNQHETAIEVKVHPRQYVTGTCTNPTVTHGSKGDVPNGCVSRPHIRKKMLYKLKQMR